MEFRFKAGICRVVLFAIIAVGCGLAQRSCFAGSKMYWTGGAAGKIQQAEISGVGITDLIINLGGAGGLSISIEGGKIYWTNPVNHKIQFADVNGSNINDLVTEGISSPADLAVDIGNGRIYP